MPSHLSAIRQGVADHLRLTVIGPSSGSTEVIDDPPHRRYLSGTLYPVGANSDEVLDEEEVELSGSAGTADEIADDPVRLANEWLPSSTGLTFFVTDCTALECQVVGSRYEVVRDDKIRNWHRVPIADSEHPERITLPTPKSRSRTRQSVLDGRAEVQAFWRPLDAGHLVTVTLVNTQRQDVPFPIDTDLCLHQVRITCAPVDGTVQEYPSVEFLSDDPEDEELRLLYRHVKTYAIGHGCAATWQTPTGDGASSVSTEQMPTYEVPPVAHAGDGDHSVLQLRRLADSALPVEVLRAELEEFVASYSTWVDSLRSQQAQLGRSHESASIRILERLDGVIRRMRQGVAVLTDQSGDPLVLEALRLANLAMLMQMTHSGQSRGGTRRPYGEADTSVPDYFDNEAAWRPFQLAYMLLTAASVVDTAHKDRDLVDLIWFPTGGGKTEAYLAVAAFEIFLRRLRFGDHGAGTAIITRYTLRLLTAQQFQRAATLTCALELIRNDHRDRMGDERITIGLWVGQGASPNTFGDAAGKFDDMLEDPEPVNEFQVESCPWCGTEIVPVHRHDDPSRYGIRSTNASFDFYCTTESCRFHDRLPIAVVDDELYQRPPTILIATVDKFARLAWHSGGGAFFGHDDKFMRPSLIIQDELHLLSGPLGTTVGLYESAVELLCGLDGQRPKVLASTATIRRASDQVAGLFGRGVELFPPPGFDARNSYYSREVSERDGRLYVGVMSQSHTSATTMINVSSSLLQAPLEAGLKGQDLDAYWTLVAYHNSLRELGRTITQARDDIPKRLEAIASDATRRRQLDDDTVVELTSNVGGNLLPHLLDRLGRPQDHPDAISFLASTNMLSVGVDIDRLGLMLVNGQPKTTSEYIQATSRVGRKDTPGLVVTMYSATRPRDRSHYESFIPYHGSLYRHVEPTSVTPYSLPSRERGLHAALVILVRHGAGLSANNQAGGFDPTNARIAAMVTALKQRATEVDQDESAATGKHLDRLISVWQQQVQDARDDGRDLYYRAASRQHAGVIKDFGKPSSEGWDTLSSMRNVDRQCSILVYGEDWN